MTTQAHTPTPWHVDPKDDQAILADPPNGWKPTPQHPRWIVAQPGLYTSPLRSEIIANAAFVVQAVNAYDANQALIAEQVAEIARLRGALVKIEEETDDNHIYEIARKALQAQEVAK